MEPSTARRSSPIWTESAVDVNPDVERPSDEWAPIGPSPTAREPTTVLFVDGVRRVDARVWIEDPDGDAQPGICASFGAGVARCGAGLRAEVIHPSVGRGVFSASPHAAEIVTRHGTYTAHVAERSEPRGPVARAPGADGPARGRGRGSRPPGVPDPDDALVVVDGPLSGRQHVDGTVGMIKTHEVAYLPPELHRLVGTLGAGERTPIFTIGSQWSRHSWYLRLPGGADAPWAGVVRWSARPRSRSRRPARSPTRSA